MYGMNICFYSTLYLHAFPLISGIESQLLCITCFESMTFAISHSSMYVNMWNVQLCWLNLSLQCCNPEHIHSSTHVNVKVQLITSGSYDFTPRQTTTFKWMAIVHISLTDHCLVKKPMMALLFLSNTKYLVVSNVSMVLQVIVHGYV